MSADLLAEFSNPPPPSPSTNSQPNRLHLHVDQHSWAQPFAQSQPADQALQPVDDDGDDGDDDDDDDDDVWGDFEVADQTAAPATPPAAGSRSRAHTPTPTSPDLGFLSIASGLQLANGLLSLGAGEERSPQRSSSGSYQPGSRRSIQARTTAPSDPNVLFDADDFEIQHGGEDGGELDSFGAFQAVEPRPTFKARPLSVSDASPAFDLLSLDDPPLRLGEDSVANETLPASGRPLSFGAISSVAAARHTTAQAASSSTAFAKQPATFHPVSTSKAPSTVRSANGGPETTRISCGNTADDGEWAAWDGFPTGNGNTSLTPASKKTAAPSSDGQKWDWNDEEDSCFASANAGNAIPPPTNVPPPAILLSVFPELFSSGDFLFKFMAGQSNAIKQQVVSNPRTVAFLQGYILIATTAARIIAGRKHRWHRDKMLAKSMSISAAGSKGMKLAGVDKTQSAREDREAADVVTSWKDYVGRLRSAVAAANSAMEANLKVPELTESVQIQTAKMVPTAAKPCVICGLKREERLSRVDLDVEDSFGEWWVDHWGHRACRNFWIQHEEKLRQR